ncbi:MAG: acyl-CoA carboxylase subunit beta [Fibrobacteria bacterium]|nr:acyl-CoA carboxylase subunit beta [Fibrobacteria bacterium]
MAIDKALLKDLAERRARVAAGGGLAKLEERRSKGIMTARDRVEALFEPDSFQEFGAHVTHHAHDFGLSGKYLPADAVVTGVGYVGGRPVAVFSQDFTVAGGSLGKMHAQKICNLMEYAMQSGMPIIGVNDSGGARIQEGVDSLSGYGQVFHHNVQASGLVPQISVIAGPCAGGAAYSPALMDFLIMIRGQANMFITGPDVIRAVTGQQCTMDEVGSADTHGAVSGNIHFIAENDEHAIQIAQELLSFLPSNNLDDPPHRPGSKISMSADPGMDELVPETSKDPLDVLKVIERLVDDGHLFEVQRDWAKNIIIGFARIEGIVVGIIANQPMVKAGTLDIDASDKSARFVRFCNAFNIPLVTLVDVPGFLPGVQQERGGIIRHGAKMLFAYAAATVPKITLILRKAYGGAYLAMCSKDMGADMVFAWPSAEIAVMGAEGAANILFRKEIKEAADPVARAAEMVAEYRSRFATPWQAAENNMITDVIEPSMSRPTIALALRNTLSKRETRPPKKHGNIPL